MIRARVSRMTLRTRFVVGMCVMLVPLFVSIAGTVVVLERTLGAIHEVVEEASAELAVLWRLQLLLERANAALQDCLVAGVRPGQCAAFVESRQTVDRAFEGAATAPFGLPEERALLHAAWDQWRRAGDIGASVLSVPAVNGRSARAVAELDQHMGRAIELLEEAHDLSEGEMATSLLSARGNRRGVFILVAAALILGVGIASFGATTLARSILIPIRALERGAERFTLGDLKYRVPAPGPPELQRLADTLNHMADALALTQAELAELSVRDSLTDLFARRELFRRMAVEEERSRRYGDPFSLLFVDLDQFKAVNDTNGHQVGDAVLQRYSRLIVQAVRPTDVVGRYGGDELAIVLPQTGREGAHAMAERIRATVATRWAAGPAEPLPAVTASIGIATYPADGASQEHLIRAADEAVYAAKRGGGDQVRVAPTAARTSP